MSSSQVILFPDGQRLTPCHGGRSRSHATWQGAGVGIMMLINGQLYYTHDPNST